MDNYEFRIQRNMPLLPLMEEMIHRVAVAEKNTGNVSLTARALYEVQAYRQIIDERLEEVDQIVDRLIAELEG